MTKLPKHTPAYSFVLGSSNFLATLIIASYVVTYKISSLASQIKVLSVTVPCINKTMSSLYSTYSSSLGTTFATFSLSEDDLLFFKMWQSKSKQCLSKS